MTERLYYTDPYRTQFTARVVEELTWQDHPAVILDRTAFYPASGGQPADRGALANTAVLDVVERDADGAILHVLSDAVAPGTVRGEVDWERRFDHMQQHTGQHILSAAFDQVLEAATVGFHLGAESSTIDVDVTDLRMENVLPVEDLANEVVWDDRPLSIHFVDADAMEDLPVPEPPPDVEGPVRLIDIPGSSSRSKTATHPHFDVNPCGGTHVARTGEIGVIKIVGLEHRGEKTRIEFLCGARAVRDYEAKRSMTHTLATMLTVGTWELDEAVERLQKEYRELRRAERELRERLLDLESNQLMGTAAVHGPYRIIGAVWQQRSPDELRILARKLADQENVVALLFTVNERTHFCFARAEGLDLDVNQLLQDACVQLEGKGGGRPQVAQGSAPRASVDDVRKVVRSLEAALERKV